MNVTRFVLAVIVAYVVMAVLAIGLEALLGDMTSSFKALHRPEEALAEYQIWMYLAYLLQTVVFCYIFTLNYENKGWMEGLRYGLLIGLFMSFEVMAWYGMMPIAGMDTVVTMIMTVVIYMGGGIATALVYKPAAQPMA
ncbi:hypothetical protein [Luteithermobacter gelatinilyticus]|uniref:hypothetical protein n=1 Tax=Luteithermobacter gelatinilyticus TaxID=2582913 RepID=UPI0011057C64|nr:hypothetical protein [Luteithermobacter gelatinilyticus]|tara:strand:- start:2770 stop:3186 length:417 start_codon:yes stop_codon:yes gene_type:complete